MDLDDNLNLDEEVDLDLDEEPYSYSQATSKRVKIITSLMGNPNRIDILKILNLKGSLSYAELKPLAGFKPKKDSGKFAYHLRKLLRQSLVAFKRSERKYTVTKLGKLVIGIALQIEESDDAGGYDAGGLRYVPDSSESVNTKLDSKNSLTFFKKYLAAGPWPYSAKKDALAMLKKSERVNRQDPKDTEVLKSRGQALGSLGRFEEAIQCFEDIITVDPEDTEALHWKACALGGLGRFEEAFKYFTQAESRSQDLRIQNFSLDRALYRVDLAKKYGYLKKWMQNPKLSDPKFNAKKGWPNGPPSDGSWTFEKQTLVEDVNKILAKEKKAEQKSTQHYAGKKAWQTIRKNQTKQAIIGFLEIQGLSRNGAIWKHIQTHKKTKVSLKVFNSYLAELVDEARVTKTEEEKPGRKYPRYSLTPEAEREKRQIILDEQWIENIGIIIVELKKNAAKISPEILAQRMYFVYSILNGLLGKQEIMQEFSYRKFLFNQGSYKDVRNLQKTIPTEMNHLFAILDNLPIRKGQAVLEKMIYLSERDYVKILGEQGKTSSDLRNKMMADYARIQLPNADQPQRLIIDNFWDGWPDE